MPMIPAICASRQNDSFSLAMKGISILDWLASQSLLFTNIKIRLSDARGDEGARVLDIDTNSDLRGAGHMSQHRFAT